MKIYTFDKTDCGIFGKAFEMAIKDALRRKNADRVSPCGVSDFRFNHKNYDTKQNGSCIRYAEDTQYIKGSNRVIYATHIAHTIVAETDTHISVAVDLASTDMYVLDKREFVAFLLEINGVKLNASRGTANIQTCYNYKRNAYHGKKGKLIEAWAQEHELEDDILGIIWDGLGL